MGLMAPVQDVLTRLSEIQATNADQVTGDIYVRLFNDQLERMRDGSGYVVPLPCLLLEVVLDNDQHQAIGQGIIDIPAVFRVHVVQQHLNTEGTMDQDLMLYALRDSVIRKLNGYRPASCGFLSKLSEAPDYSHDNVQHHTIEFETIFRDITGSKLDADTGDYVEGPTPLTLQIDVNGEQTHPHT